LNNNQRPYGVEVIGDPYDVFAPGSVEHPFRAFFRWLGTKQLKDQCAGAAAAAYVTANALQKRYPTNSYSTHYSSIAIGKDYFAAAPRIEFGINGNYRLVLVGSLAQLYKAPDVLIDAVAICRARGRNVTLRIAGDGKFRPKLEGQVARLGLGEAVTFLGQLPNGEAVRNELLMADLFVLPSRTEGLPKAMVEAMACGLPSIGSNVGGIPELLPEDCMVPPGNASALADRIEEFISDPERMRAMSARNIQVALDFRRDILDQRRREFYTALRNKTESWLQAKTKSGSTV
jgi:glycosyltransferase involved in cell wall biosynthesis